MVSGTTPRLYYRKAGRGWTDVPASEAAAAAGPRFIIDQGANTPPRLALVDPKTRAGSGPEETAPDPGEEPGPDEAAGGE